MTRRVTQLKILMHARRWCELVVLISGCLASGYAFSSCSNSDNTAKIVPTESLPETSEFSPVPVIDPNADFSKFQHSNPEHSRFPCALCHRREDNSPVPKLSGHLPCAGCHVAQFADNKNAICTICHTSADTGVVKRFPVLRSFNVLFDHAKHLRRTNCADCHRPSRNGVSQSIPSGLSAHTACFQCHSPGTQSGERNIDSCNVCHQPGKSSQVSDWAKAYTVNFSHARHKLNCTNCHSVKSGASRGNQLTAPVASMHFASGRGQSCATCHNNKRAFGGSDFSDCRRCHEGKTFRF